MRRISITLFAALGLVLGMTGAEATAPPAPSLDPEVPATTGSADDAAVSSNFRFIKNIPYPQGSDIEFGEFTVKVLDESGNPICETDAAGECLVDGEGNVIYRTEQRDYAFAGSYQGTRVVDITVPEEASVVAYIDCRVSQGDIQVRVDLGLLGIGVDSNSNFCGMGATQGVLLFDISDPRFPEQVGVYKDARGAHNLTFHPTAPLMYISDSDVANSALGRFPIVDISNPASPTLVRTVTGGDHSPHDITFNAAGTRAYIAAISRTEIWNTTDPRNPSLISTIYDPSVNIHHQADPTPNGQYLIIADELAGAATGPVCPGGGLHIYNIAGSNETRPQPAGVFFANDVGGPRTLCTAHVFRINPDGRSLTIGWYSGGTRIVDITNIATPTEIAHIIPTGLGGNNTVANSWASKTYKGYTYSNDRARGLDIMMLAGSPIPPAPEDSLGVVGVIDTGINPYHQEFRWDDPRALQHPSTYIPGYPEDAIALPITLDEPDYWKAVKQDCNTIWKTVQTGKLYWFPGTKIIGGISFGNVGGMTNCAPAQPGGGKILDTGSHGTMTASRATGRTLGACRECLVVAIQNPLAVPIPNFAASNQEVIDSIGFAADNASWIDAQSNSWGPIVFPGWEPTGQLGLLTANPALVRKVEEVSQKHLAFWASGNGAAGRGGVIGSPTIITPTLTPSAISVGGHDAGYMNTWPGFPPHVISDSCDGWAAQHRSTTGANDSVSGGTSGATPFAAGGAARILMEARGILGDTRTGVRNGTVAEGTAGLVASGPLADGKLTMAEWKELVFKTATARPTRQFEDGGVCNDALNAPYNTTPVWYEAFPEELPPFFFTGYGAVDDPALLRAFAVLGGTQPLPVRTIEDAYFTGDAALRGVLHQVYRGGPT